VESLGGKKPPKPIDGEFAAKEFVAEEEAKKHA
jgi:hypothetical protein